MPVVAPLGDRDFALVQSADAAVAQLWSGISRRLGDTLEARVELVRALEDVPGILDAALGPDGVDVAYRFTTGWLGLLILNRPDAGVAAPAPAAHPRTASPAVSGAAISRGIFKTCGPGTPPDAICCDVPERRLPLLGRRVLVWATGFFRPGLDDGPIVEDTFRGFGCLGHTIEKITGGMADVASVARFKSADTLVISTHGGVDSFDGVVIATSEEQSDTRNRHYAELLDAGLLAKVHAGNHNTGADVPVYAVADVYVQTLPGSFPERAIVYASHCYSGYNRNPRTYLDSGAGIFLGYDWKVTDAYTVGVAKQLFDGLLKRFKTVGDAYESVTPKTDRQTQTGSIPGADGKRQYITKAANFIRDGETRIAYVGQPDVSPDTSMVPAGGTATLETTVEGEGDCDLTYHWHNSGDAGHLDGGNDFQTTSSSTTYTAEHEPEDDDDQVGVELLSPDGNDPIGASCADAMVVTTTTTTTSTTTTTLFGCPHGLLASAEVLQTISASADAFAEGEPFEPPVSYIVGPNELITVGPGGGSGVKPWDLSQAAGGASALSRGTVTWEASPCEVTSHGVFSQAATGGGEKAGAQSFIYASIQIAVRVLEDTPYELTGFVRAVGDATESPPQSSRLMCTSRQMVVGDANLQNPAGTVPFEEHHVMSPQGTHLLFCQLGRSGASANMTGDDHADLEWQFTLRLGVE
jgi:hypothetical protein